MPATESLVIDCEKEKIHLPGCIQPTGILLAVEDHGPEWRIRNASANCWLLGLPASEAIGRPLSALCEGRLSELLAGREAEGNQDWDNRPTFLGHEDLPELQQAEGDWAKSCVVLAHRQGRLLILEIEFAAPPRRSAFEYLHILSQDFGSRLKKEQSVEGAAEVAADEVRRILGFDRTLVYRFDAGWHGMVIAEKRNNTRLPSYLNFRFPATDIPPQARELYRVNRVRSICDTEQTAVAIVGDGSEHLDLTYALLRSISPTHIQYMRNMGTRASVSISILVNGNLWGLISSHNAHAALVSFKQRLVCDLIAEMLAQQIVVAKSLEGERRRARMKGGPARLLGWMGSGVDLADVLRKHTDELLEVAPSEGAAIVLNGRCTRFGRTPPEKQILRLAGFMHQTGYCPSSGTFASDRISALVPELKDYAHSASGVLSISLSSSTADCLIWFRPEVAYTVRWAGEPTKAMQTIDGVTRFHPRLSFEEWLEQVVGQSEPWHPVELESVTSLRHGILSVIDRKALEDQLMQAQKLESIGQLAAGVAHEINTPIQFVGDNNAFLSESFATLTNLITLYRRLLTEQGFGQALQKAEQEADLEYLEGEIPLALNQSRDGIQRVTEIVRAMKEFSHPATSSMQPADLHHIIESTIALSRNEWKLVASVEKIFDPNLPMVPCMAGGISQTILNLIVNASHAIADAKRSADDEEHPGEIVIRTRQVGSSAEIRVEDNGLGIPAEVHPKIFTPFFTTKAVGKGTGQGLALAWTTIVKRHGGSLDFETEEGKGTAFIIRLPLNTASETERVA
jgi:two-component system, chemotaxis family, sensor kinase Cph1